jgi:hypothetical protein
MPENLHGRPRAGCLPVSAMGSAKWDRGAKGRNGLIRNPPARRCATDRRAFIALGQQHGSDAAHRLAHRLTSPASSEFMPLAQNARCPSHDRPRPGGALRARGRALFAIAEIVMPSCRQTPAEGRLTDAMGLISFDEQVRQHVGWGSPHRLFDRILGGASPTLQRSAAPPDHRSCSSKPIRATDLPGVRKRSCAPFCVPRA